MPSQDQQQQQQQGLPGQPAHVPDASQPTLLTVREQCPSADIIRSGVNGRLGTRQVYDLLRQYNQWNLPISALPSGTPAGTGFLLHAYLRTACFLSFASSGLYLPCVAAGLHFLRHDHFCGRCGGFNLNSSARCMSMQPAQCSWCDIARGKGWMTIMTMRRGQMDGRRATAL